MTVSCRHGHGFVQAEHQTWSLLTQNPFSGNVCLDGGLLPARIKEDVVYAIFIEDFHKCVGALIMFHSATSLPYCLLCLAFLIHVLTSCSRGYTLLAPGGFEVLGQSRRYQPDQ